MRFFNIHSVAEHEKIEENKNFYFREKVSQCRKTEREDLWDFSTSILSQSMNKLKKTKIFIFGKKSQCRKTERGDLWGFSTSILSQNIKKLKGNPLGKKISKKVSQCRKKMDGGTLWSRPVWYAMRKNRKNLFGSVR